MINPNELIRGQCYFLLLFYDSALKVPSIRTFIYIGRNLQPTPGDKWYFQDARSYLRYGTYLDLPDNVEREVFIADKDTLTQMHDKKGLIEQLLKNVVQ